MSGFSDKESGYGSSYPVDLLRFKYGSQEFLYTNADEDDLVYQGKLYQMAAILVPDIEGMSDPDKGTLSITAPLDLAVVQQVLTVPPSEPVELFIVRCQRELTDMSGNLLTSAGMSVWKGRVHTVEVADNQANLQCISILHHQYRMGNTLKFQKSCPYALYDGWTCKADKARLAVTTNAAVVSATKIQSDDFKGANLAFPGDIPVPVGMQPGWFVGGYLQYSDVVSGVSGRRAIIASDKDTGQLTVFPPLRGLVSGAQVTAFAGCKHDTKDCYLKHNNLPNYGGDPVMPLVDPYDPYAKVF